MKLLSKLVLLSGILILSTSVIFAQSQKNINYTFTEISPSTASLMGTPQITATDYKVYQMNITGLLNDLDGIASREDVSKGFIANINFPHPDGSIHAYQATSNNTMDPELAAKFPTIRSFDAKGVSNGAKVKWDVTPHGLHAMIMLPGESTIFIDPLIKGNTQYYIVYHKKDFVTTKMRDCGFNANTIPTKAESSMTVKSFGTCELRTYRLAVAATGEYTTFHGGTVALAQAAQVTTMNRVNGVYERDMAITMTIIGNNNLLIYTNAATDPYTNGTPGSMINENQTNCNTVIGNANYDVGHVFGTNSGGLAGLGVVCITNQKARGVTGSSAPIGDPFDIDYVAHETGHQFGANHTQNNNCNRNNATAMEPGSASTIMGYAGICAPNVQSNSDDHFHGISLQEIGNHITSTSCPVTTVLANSAPVITGTNGNITIPASTPFALTAFANDPDGDVLSYCWEQMDNQVSTQSPVPTSTGGPNFRSNSPINDSTRYFPNLVDLAAGGPFTWEVLPSVSRTMNFRVTVRDQSLGVAGCNDHTDITVTTDGGSGPFIVTYPSATGIVWAGLTTETVTWSVAGTDVAPVACANVDILLSTDGGLTYPTVLASNVPNDGSQNVTVPNVATTTARIMVICSNGTFFDISDNNFEITMATYDYTLSASPASLDICQPNDAVFTVDVGSVGGYVDPVTLSVSGVPAGATSAFSVNPVTPVGSSTLTISNTAAAAPGIYILTITGVSTTGTKTTDVTLTISTGSPSAVTQIAPANGATGVAVPTNFTWTTAPEVGVTYEIDIATDAGFVSIVDAATGLASASYTSTALSTGTTYYWRVRSVTGCGQSAWSTTFSFTTNSCTTYVSTNVGQIISAATTTSTIVITDAGTITDANIPVFDLSHVYVGDLGATLTSPLGTVVQLFDGPGIPASTYGCNGDNIVCTFDDAAALTATDFENMCNGTPPAITGDFQSIDPMANFNGESITGTWTLTVFDSYTASDDGVLNNWSLELCTAGSPCTAPDVPTISGTTVLCTGGSTTLSIASGNLNDATSWEWYTGSCGGTSAGTGTSLTVTPGTTTTYYVRGEGGCVTPGACASVTVTVGDANPPTITCPGNQTEIVDASCQATLANYLSLATVVDDCDPTPTVTQSPAAGTIITAVTTVTITALDGSGNSSSCNFIVTPVDNTAPVVSCPPNQTTCLATMPDYTSLVTITDNCDASPSVTQSPAPGTAISGTVTVTMTGTDASANSSNCVFTVTAYPSYNNTESVTICDGDTYIYPDGNPGTVSETHTSMLTTVNGCDSIIITTLTVDPIASAVTQIAPANGATGVSIPTTFTWTIAPEAGVTYEIDIATDAGFTAIVDAATGLATASYTSLSLTINTTYYWRVRAVTPCGASAWSGTYNFTTSGCSQYTATDVPQTISAGTPSSITSIISVPTGGTINDVNVIDLIGTHTRISDLTITLTSPLGTTVTLMDQVCNNEDNFDVDFDDAAASPVLPCPPTDGLAYQPNGLLSAFNGEDAAGNWTLTVSDVQNMQGGSLQNWILEVCVDPTVACTDPDVPTLSGITTICPSGTTSLSIATGNLNDATAWQWYTGSCGGTSVGSGASLAVAPAATTTYYVRGEGGCVTPGACAMITVTVEDLIDPTISCPATQTVIADALCQGTLPDYTGLAVAADDCDPAPVVTQIPAPGTTISGTTTITLTAMDASGNSASCNFVVNVVDATDPVVTCPSTQTVAGDASCMAVLADYTGMATVSDNCDASPTITQSPAAGTSFTGSTTVTITATDASGNSASCNFVVNIIDNTDPVISCPSTQTVNADASCQGILGDYTALAIVSDNCDASPVVTQLPAPGTTISGTTTITLTAIDASGNSASCNFVVNIVDATDPVVTCPSTQTVAGDASCMAVLADYTGMATVSDNCDASPTVTQSPAAGTSFTGSTTVTITATDASGNSASCNFVVNIIDNTDPVISCPANQSTCQTTMPSYTGMVTVSDNCDASPTVTQSPAAGTAISGVTTVIMMATDASGNTSTCTFDVTVIPAYNESATATICSGSSYTFGTQTLTSAGIYTELFTSSMGCDSTVTLTLNVTPGYTVNETATICDGDTYTFPDGNTGTTTQVYTSNLVASNGCDSTVVTALTVTPASVATEDIEICEGQSYTFPDGNVGTTTQAHTSVLTGSNGCDSIIVTALTVHPAYTITENVTICEGESYTYPDGNIGTSNESHTSLLTTTFGCDSVIITNLNVQNIDQTVSQSGSTLTANQTGATYQWIDCDNGNTAVSGAINQSFKPDSTGNYAVVITIGACSDTSNCVLVDYTAIHELNAESIAIYPNPTTGKLTVEWEGDVEQIEITDAKGKLLERITELSDHTCKVDMSMYSSGVYFIHVLSDQGRLVFDVMKQ